MLSFSSVMIGTEDPGKLARFYEAVLEKKPDMAEEGWFGWSVGEAFISIGRHDQVKGVSLEPQRVMFNFETKEVKEEFDRIKTCGGTVIKEPYQIGDGWIATFADPDGNYFQLMTPWNN